MKRNIKRGEIYFAGLNSVAGSEQSGTRPIPIVQNNVGNYYSPTVIGAAITSIQAKAKLPTHVNIDGLPYRSLVHAGISANHR